MHIFNENDVAVNGLEPSSFTANLDLKFFKQNEFESHEGLSSAEQAPIIVRNVLRILMMGWTESWKELLTPTLFYAVFIARNYKFSREIRFAFAQSFSELFSQLKDQQFNETQREQIQLYLSNCLSILPFSDLTAYQSIKIPQYIDGAWELVS